jgi:hypothetical protein
MGNNMIFEHIKVIRFGVGVAGVECFAMGCFAGSGFSSTTFSNILVSSCIFANPATGNHDGLSTVALFANSSFGNVLANTLVTGCSFLNIASDFLYSHAFGAPVCSGNVVDGCQIGFYSEPSTTEQDYTITNNVFRNCTQALRILWDDNAASGEGNILFANNQIIAPVAGFMVVVDDSALVTNRPVIQSLTIRDNFYSTPIGETRNGMLGIKLNSANKYGINKLTITGNTFPVSPAAMMNIANTGIVSQLVQNNIADQ